MIVSMMGTSPPYWVLLLLAFLLVHPINGFSFRLFKHETKAPPKIFTNELDIVTSLIIADEGNQYGNYITHLESLKSMPTCYEIATGLTNYCRSVGADSGHVKDRALEIENSKKLFAIRLAFCELRPANPTLPTQCSAIINPGDAKEHWFQSKSQFNETFAPPSQVDSCLAAVYKVDDHSEWWTSYSNNKQNVDAWCHLTRLVIEKGQMLETQKSAVVIMGQAASMLSEQTQRQVKLQEDQRRAGEQISALQLQAVEAMETGNEALRSYVENFFQGLQHELSRIPNNVASVDNAVKNLDKTVAESELALKETFRSLSDAANQLGKEVSVSTQNVQAGLIDLRANLTEYAAFQSLYHEDMQEQQRISQALMHKNSAEMANIVADAKFIGQSLGWLKLVVPPWRYIKLLIFLAVWWGFALILWMLWVINGPKAVLFAYFPVFIFAIYKTLGIVGEFMDRISEFVFDEQLLSACLVVPIVCGLAIWRYLSTIRRPRRGPPYHDMEFYEDFDAVQKWNRLCRI